LADTATIDSPAAPEAAASGPSEGQQSYSPRPRRDSREGGGGRGGPRDFRARRKVCIFCVEKIKEIDFKDTGRLRRFISDRGKIEPRRKTGTCAKHQRRLSVALKRARFMALLPYTGEHIRSLEPVGGGGRDYDRRDVGRPDRGGTSEVPQANAALAEAGESAPPQAAEVGEGAPPEAAAATPEERPAPAEQSTETPAADA
jgi:small subunit ribosomal protein S18